MGLEMNTNIVEGIFYSLPAPSYATYVLLYDDFSLFPPNQCCRSSGTLGKVGRNTEKPQMSDWRNMRPIYI